VRVFGRQLFPGIVNFADEEEKIVPFLRVGKRGNLPARIRCFALSEKMYNPENKTE